MDIVTIDFETYYDKDYSLSKITTEAYIRSPLFEVIGVGVKVNDGPVDTYSGDNPGKFLRSLDYTDKAILCHNTVFDGAILSWKFDIKPKLWLDTLSMARPKHASTVGGSLKALAQHYELGAKGEEVIHALGKRRADFSSAELAQYMRYCANDVDLTYALFRKLKKGFPVDELRVIDTTLRMYTEPMVELDEDLLQEHLARVLAGKLALMDSLGGKGKDMIMSNEKFAKLLRRRGVTPPMKTSPATGKETYAFAKTDLDFVELQDHHDPVVQALVCARLGLKSTLEETRTRNLTAVARRGPLPIMLNYYGAHTGRFSGGDKLNLQNLPSRGDNTIRRALRAPEGHKIISCDSSQIEARMVAYLAGQADLVQQFRENRDVYSEFASEIYQRKITKADKVERFVGKTCLASGTQVLTQRGWVRIVDVQQDDLLWDGLEWVRHHGVSFMGVKQTISLSGVELTPDHEILTEATKWAPAKSALENPSVFASALLSATLPSSAMKNIPPSPASLGAGDLYAGVHGATQSFPTSQVTCAMGALPPATVVQSARPQTNGGGDTRTLCQMTCTEVDYSIDCLPQSTDATTLRTGSLTTMEGAVYTSTNYGATTQPSSYGTSSAFPVGMSLRAIWTALTTKGGTNPVTSGSQLDQRTRPINDESLIWKPVYDILNCGSRNRFTVLTDAGPMIVHNCILGLGYMTGAAKLRDTLKRGQGDISVDLTEDEAQDIVDIYRRKNHHIVKLWGECGYALSSMVAGRKGRIGNVLTYDADGIILPNGMVLRYHGLHATDRQFTYIQDRRMFDRAMKARLGGDTSAVGSDLIPGQTRIYGGKVTENVVQALARIVVSGQMLAIRDAGYHVAFQVHDENVCVVPEDKAEQAQKDIVELMSTPPAWAPDLPVACEAGMADTYGDA